MAKQPSDSEEIFFPEFENYQIYKGSTVVPNPEKLTDTFRNIAYGLGSVPSYLKEKYDDYEVGSKIKTGISYIYNASKPVVQYASNKFVKGAKYLYNKLNENINGTSNNDGQKDNNSNSNIISLNEDNNVQHSSLVFVKAEGLDEEKEEREDNSNSGIQEYPSLSKINQNEINNNNEKSDVNNAAQVELTFSHSDKKDEE